MRLIIAATRHRTCEGILLRSNSGHLLLVAQRIRCKIRPSKDPLHGDLRHPQATNIRILLFTMAVVRLVEVDTTWVLGRFALSVIIQPRLHIRNI